LELKKREFYPDLKNAITSKLFFSFENSFPFEPLGGIFAPRHFYILEIGIKSSLFLHSI
jgi:hypothetical protein